MMRAAAAARPTTKAVFGTTAVAAVASARRQKQRRGRRLGEGRGGGQRRRSVSFWNGPDDVVGAIIGRRIRRRRQRRTTSVEATTAEEEEEEAETTTKTTPLVYDGHYGQWSVSRADEVEVWSYRIALSLSCCGALGVAAGCVFGKDGAINPSYFVGASGLGVALVLVHMYVTPIKRAMQAMYAVGLVGSVGIAATQSGGESGGANVLEFVRDHPSAMWLVGPMFASFTGLAFKEGACYGKPEAFALFLLTPIMCLGHLTGLASGEAETFLVASWMFGFCVFAGRKYTQEVKDDIGDKSVFIFRSLKTDEERRDYLEKQGKDLSLLEDAM
tara:strand:- start:2442 stop:3431 length:990 start_codon:yes stop_codon:yes gene_type:complete